MEVTTYSIEEVLNILPHRYPFLFVDKVLEVSAESNSSNRTGRNCRAIKNFTYNEYFFPGHFPGRPMVPGVILLETMAQVGALASYRPGDPPMNVAIVTAREVKWRRPVLPGDSCIVEAKVTRDRGQMLVLDCRIEVDGQCVVEGEIMAHVTPKE